MAEGSDFRLEFDPAMLAGFLRALKAFEPALATATRRQLRRAGDVTIADMRRTVTSGPGGGGPVQSGISAGLRTGVVTGKRRQGVRLMASSARLAEGRKPMLRLYNKASWRHPVFGTSTWVEQPGRPYFGTVIKRHEDEMVEAVLTALEEAFTKMQETT